MMPHFAKAWSRGVRAGVFGGMLFLVLAGRDAPAQWIKPVAQTRSIEAVVQAMREPVRDIKISSFVGAFDELATAELFESGTFGGQAGEVSAFSLAAQRSTISANAIQAFGTVAGTALGANGASPRYVASSDIDVAFRLDTAVSFQFTGAIALQAIDAAGWEGSGAFTLTGPNGIRYTSCVGRGCSPMSDLATRARGVLPTGEYRLQASVDVQSRLAVAAEGEFAVDLQVAPLPTRFHSIRSIRASTRANDLWSADHLIQGPGIGFQATAPFEKTASGSAGNWVTQACGFPCDYLATNSPPILTVDLGENQPLFEMDVWGYDSSNANGASELRLRFATEADGPTGFGASIPYQPTFDSLVNDDTIRQPLIFQEPVFARYIEITLGDNFFVAPGNGSGGETPGGDRVGLGEIAFPAPIPGDVNLDNILDVRDIDRLTQQIAVGSVNPQFDVNEDGVVNATDVAVWIQDIANTWTGDVNLDGEFNSRDLIEIFVAGGFESDEPAVWSQGDWNADGLFSSSDLVAAFIDGGYDQGRRSGAIAVPEPVGWSNVLLLGIAFSAWRSAARACHHRRSGRRTR